MAEQLQTQSANLTLQINKCFLDKYNQNILALATFLFLRRKYLHNQLVDITMITARPRKIEKDQLKTCTFTTPIYTDNQERSERNKRLYLAMLMGNNFESKVKIVFNTLEGYREIFTTVWATTEKFVLLQGGSYIPLESIASVEMDQSKPHPLL